MIASAVMVNAIWKVAKPIRLVLRIASRFRRAIMGTFPFFSGLNGDLEPVFKGGQRAGELIVVGTIGVISQVEINQKFAVIKKLWFEVSPSSISFCVG